MCVPFTLRGFPKKLDELEVNNDFACIPYWLQFPKNEQTNERQFLNLKDLSTDSSFKVIFEKVVD